MIGRHKAVADKLRRYILLGFSAVGADLSAGAWPWGEGPSAPAIRRSGEAVR